MAIHPAAMQPGSELAGKVALVTGATRNIGRSIALSLAAGGATVAVNSRALREDGDKVVAEIRAAGGQAETFVADISDGQAIYKMVDAIVARFGRVDLLVLNANSRKYRPFIEMSFEEWRSVLGLTLDGSFHCVKACLPHMIEAGGGAIVTLGGLMALSGAKNRVHGSVVKHGLVGMTRALALEVAQHKIRINCVAPGATNTSDVRGEDVAVRPAPSATIPLGFKAEPEEIASVVRFLCGPGASFITGQTLHVNGGQMMF
jgi:3-oxoacyl-[acyl-carrier protein] reductase